MNTTWFYVIFAVYMIISYPVFKFFLFARNFYLSTERDIEPEPVSIYSSVIFSLLAFAWPASISFFVLHFIFTVLFKREI
mgnify:CR=1 FL=1